jgi:hypothetical protein
MQFGKEKRKFIAENATQIARFILSIVILGQIISASINWWLLIGSGLVFITLILLAIACPTMVPSVF